MAIKSVKMNVGIDQFITNLTDSFSNEIMQRIADKIQPRLTFQYLSDGKVLVAVL